MTVFLDGRFVPKEEARISVLDRGFTYGDGIFETIKVTRGEPLHWHAHMARLQRGLAFLQIRLPAGDLEQAARQLVKENSRPDAVLRLVISRGPGPRGYSPRGAESPTVVMTLHDPPRVPVQSLRLLTSSYRIHAGDPLLQHKTCNKLLHILARAEADQHGFDEALLLNDRSEAVTATSANLFWVMDEAVYTAPVASGALPGLTRAMVQELCVQLGIEYVERALTREALTGISGAFLTSTTLGTVPVHEIDQQQVGTVKLISQLSTAQRQVSGGYPI